MVRMRYQIARWVMAHHAITGVICGLITIFFAIGLRNVRIKPIFVDLLPHNDSFVQVRGVKTTTDLNRLSPWEYIQATKRNRGLAKIYAKSNIVTANGRPWIGGNPFPDPNSAIELFAALTLGWGRHDASFSAIKEYNLAVIGNVEFLYESGSYDRRGEPYRSLDGVYSLYEYGEKHFMEGAYPYWSWAHAHAFDVQSGRMSRLEQVRTISGGYATSVNDASIYEHYLTPAALMRLGNA